MAEKRAFHRSPTFYILSGLLLVIFGAGIFVWRNYKYRLVNRKVDNLVTVKSKGLYEVNYKNLKINEALGNISAENIEMLPDSQVYQSLLAQKNAPDKIFRIRVPELIITGVKTPKALFNKEISAHIIKFENAEIEVRLRKGNKEKQSNSSTNTRSDLYRELLGNLKSIHADSVILENASLTLRDDETKDIRYRANGLSLRFAGLAIDSLEQKDSSRIFFSKELAIHCNQFEVPSKNKEYDLQISGTDFNSQTGNIHIDRVKLKPRLSESSFAKAHTYAKDRFDFLIGNVDIKQIRRSALLHQQLIADTLQISEASFRVFRDKSYPHDSVDRTHTYPQEAIMLLPVSVYLKKIILKNGYIEYKEKNEKSDSSGKVAFFHAAAKFENVTNMPEYISMNNQMLLHFTAVFLNETPFTANFRMRLNDPKGNFIMDARLGAIQAVLLNPLLKPMALTELDKGNISGLQYHLNATNINGKGTLTLTYDHLSVKFLKKDNDKNKYKTKVLPTLAAGFVLKEANPQNGQTRLGTADYKRDIHRSIFNLMWKSLLTCIKQVMM